jgi:hypothetical protein
MPFIIILDYGYIKLYQVYTVSTVEIERLG